MQEVSGRLGPREDKGRVGGYGRIWESRFFWENLRLPGI